MTKPSEGSKELFKIIEPAMFNYPDEHYIDKALADLEAHVKAEIRKTLERLKEQLPREDKRANDMRYGSEMREWFIGYNSATEEFKSAIDNEIKELEER